MNGHETLHPRQVQGEAQLPTCRERLGLLSGLGALCTALAVARPRALLACCAACVGATCGLKERKCAPGGKRIHTPSVEYRVLYILSYRATCGLLL
jgi:hypothetical protein